MMPRIEPQLNSSQMGQSVHDLKANAEDFPYESIRGDLQRKAVEACKSLGAESSWERSSEKIFEIALEVANHPFFQRLCRPDLTKYTIDYMIWKYFFGSAGCGNQVPFTAINPLIARPLSHHIDFSTLPENPFPVFVPVVDYTNNPFQPKLHVTVKGKEVSTRSDWDLAIETERLSLGKPGGPENLTRQDSGYGSDIEDHVARSKQVEEQKSYEAMREDLEGMICVTTQEARRHEDKIRYHQNQVSILLAHVERLEAQELAICEREERTFDDQDRLIQLVHERSILNDGIQPLSRCSKGTDK